MSLLLSFVSSSLIFLKKPEEQRNLSDGYSRETRASTSCKYLSIDP